MRLRNLLWILTAVSVLALALGTVSTLSAEEGDKPESRAELTNFQGKDIKGKLFRKKNLKGKVAVLNFWATWCSPCKQELPFLEEYYRKHKDDGLVVVAIATDGPDTVSKATGYAKRQKWTMPVLLDQDGTIAQKLNPRGNQPFTIFVDHKGRIYKSHEGFAPGDEKEQLKVIEKLLAERKADQK